MNSLHNKIEILFYEKYSQHRLNNYKNIFKYEPNSLKN